MYKQRTILKSKVHGCFLIAFKDFREVFSMRKTLDPGVVVIGCLSHSLKFSGAAAQILSNQLNIKSLTTSSNGLSDSESGKYSCAGEDTIV